MKNTHNRIRLIAPSNVYIVGGVGYASQPLLAFDFALLDAGIGDYNLISVSSIVPPYAKLHLPETSSEFDKVGHTGAFLHCVISSHTSVAQEKISAALAVAVPGDEAKPGLIYEAHGRGGPDRYKTEVFKMAMEGMRHRGTELKDVEVVSRQADGYDERYASVVVAAVMV